MGKLIFIRHGQTEYNKKKLYFGILDPGLNEQGHLDAKKALEKIKDINYDKIYASPLLRASQTAEIINHKNNEIIYDKRLQEMDFGIVEGLSYEEIKKKYPELLIEMKENWEDFNYVNGESPKDMQKRVIDFLNSLDYSKVNIIVAHYGTINSAISYLLSNNLDLYWKFNTKNGDVIILKGEKNFMYLSRMF